MDFYIYEWFNVDTGEVYYVGKGRDDRYKSFKNRNRYFLNYTNKYNCDVRIVQSGLSNDEAYDNEKKLIGHYKDMGLCKTNIAIGGKGGIRLFGEQNPMFGRPWWDEFTTQEEIDNWKKSVACKGESNGMYGISPKERMSDEVYQGWLKKLKVANTGVSNPNYGNDTLSKKYKANPALSKEKQGRPGKQNGRCIPISLYSSDMEHLKDFDYMTECAEHLIELGVTKTSKQALAAKISEKKKSGKPYKGYYFK